MLLTLDYLNLITSEHRTKPKFMKMLEEVFQMSVDAANQLENISHNLDIETAKGEQLTILGLWLGQSRNVSVETNGSIDFVTDDKAFRFLLKAKMVKNVWDGTIEGVYKAFDVLFPELTLVLVDNQDMSCNLTITGEILPLEATLLTYDMLIPKPAGVKYNYTFVNNPLFSYNLNNETFKGYNEGYWESKYSSRD